MKAKGILGSLVGVAVVAAVGIYLRDPNMVRKSLNLPHVDELGSYVDNSLKESDWADPAALQAKLGPQILAKIGNVDDRSVRLFLKDDGNRLLLARWMMAQKFLDPMTLDMETKGEENRKNNLEKARKDNAELHASVPQDGTMSYRQDFNVKRSDENLAKLEKEAKAPHTLAEVRKKAGAAALLTRIGNTLTWAEQFAFGNECQQPAVAISILNTIARRDRNFDSKTIYRDIATATALEYARSGWRQEDAVERYKFYATQYRDGNLNAVFKDLPFWQRRMVCGCKGDNDFGSIESLEWLVENAKLAVDQYPGACWRCGYHLNNPYGESIHGSQFAAPFDEVYGHNRARFTAEVGGVCGSLSHFGAFAALANGVPAMTAGEPAHCAYIVLVGDKWTPSYSLSWQRGLHWTVWKDNHRFSALHMASELYSAEQKETTALADAYRVLAGEMARQGKTSQAIRYYRDAVTAQPLHYVAWREYALFLAEKAADDVSAWCDYNRAICDFLVPVYPELADVLLSSHVYTPMAKAMESEPERLRTEFLRFWASVGEMGPDRWNIENLISLQTRLSGINEKDAAGMTSFAAKLIGEMAGAEKYLPVVLGWANTASGKFAEEKERQVFLQSIVQALGDVQGEGSKQVLAPLILAAEKSHDLQTFRKIASMLNDDMPRPGIPKFEPFPGKLVSEDGLIRTSSTCNFDAPCEHPGVLQSEGGRFHSAKEVNPYVVVELPKQAHLNGIVIVGTAHNQQRLYDMHVQVSETGKDDDWQDVAVLPNGTPRVQRVDLQDKRPLAKYVRVKRGGDKQEFFHLNAIYVYGVPAA